MTEAHVCQQLAQGRYLTAARPGVELATSGVASQRLNHYTTRPHYRFSVDHPGMVFYRVRSNEPGLLRTTEAIPVASNLQPLIPPGLPVEWQWCKSSDACLPKADL